jgi:hypothetical protein
MSAGVQSYNSVPLSAGLMDIPTSMLSDSQPRLIASQVRQVQLPSASGNQSAGGVINFQLSTGVGQGYLKRGSCYLRTTIVISTNADMSGAAVPCRLDLAAGAYNAFGGPLAMASHVINRLTLLSGGSVIEQINNYHVVADVVNAHASSKSYIGGDAQLYENALQTITTGTCDSASATTLTITVTIPLLSGLLQGNHHLPLFLLSGNLQLQLDLNSQAIGFVGTANSTAVSFTNNTLMYEQLNVDAVMEATLKQSLMRAPFQIPFNSFVSLAAAVVSAATVSQPIGLNLSSVYGVLVAEVASSALDNRKYMVKAGLNSIKLFADGRLVNSHLIDTDPLFFAEMNKVFNLAFDATRTSCIGFGNDLIQSPVAARVLYDSYIFASGVCMTRVSEDGVVMAGSPVNQLLVELQHGGANPANTTAYYIVPHQLILTVDIAGVAAVIR